MSRRLSKRSNLGRARAWIAATAAAAILMAAAASVASAGGSSSLHFTGSVSSGGTVRFTANRSKGKIVRVVSFSWAQVPLRCAQETTVIDENYGLGVAVKNHKFHGNDANVPPHTSIDQFTGRLNSQGTAASGTLRTHGTEDNGFFTGCDTGTVSWTAHR
jgi:hypothetical protein